VIERVVLLTDIFQLIRMSEEMFGPIYRTWMGNKPHVHLLQPEDVEVMSSRKMSAFFFNTSTIPYLVLYTI